MKFRLREKVGSDQDINGKTYVSGDIVESEQDLCILFKNKFELVHEDIVKPTKPVIPTPPAKDDDAGEEAETSEQVDEDSDEDEGMDAEEDENTEEDSDEEATPAEIKYGVDVTDEFPTAVKVGAKVYKRGMWHTCIDPEDKDEVLNDKKLRANKVEAFLANYLEEDDNDAEG